MTSEVNTASTIVTMRELPGLYDDSCFLHTLAEAGDDEAGGGESGQQAVEALERLRVALAYTPGVPTVVGSGRASRHHKLHAILHADRLVCSSWQQVCALQANTVSWTVDMGTEFHITGLRQVQLQTLFPWADVDGPNLCAARQ